MFKRCPIAWLREDAAAELQLVTEVSLFRERSILPRSGGWRDQDPRFIEAIPIVESEIALLKKWAGDTAAVVSRGN